MRLLVTILFMCTVANMQIVASLGVGTLPYVYTHLRTHILGFTFCNGVYHAKHRENIERVTQRHCPLIATFKRFHHASILHSTSSLHDGSKKILKRMVPIYSPLCTSESGDCDIKELAKDLTLEHVVPLSIIKRTVAPVRGKAMFRRAARDMHNLFACKQDINNIRSNYPFTGEMPVCHSLFADYRVISLLEGYAIHVGGCNFLICHNPEDISLKKGSQQSASGICFAVNEKYRGLVARCILYMHDRWGCPPDQCIVGGLDQAKEWHEKYAVSDIERVHNYVVYKLQKNVNPYIATESETRTFTGIDTWVHQALNENKFEET